MAGDYSDLDQFPETWELKRIGDFASVKGGKRLPAGTALVPTRTNHPYIRIVDFKDGGIDKSGLMFVPDDVFPQIARYTISARDIYVSIVGTIGLVGVVDKSLDGANLTENAAKICNIADDVDRDYLAAFLGSGWGQHQIGALTVGSTQPKLALFRIGDIRVPLPPLAEQKAIAAVLGALDDKIELNRRMNATLEAMARALFQSWFVDFDPVRAKLDGRPAFPLPLGEGQGEGVADLAALFPDSFQDSELGHIPKEWKVGTLDELTSFVIGGDWGANERTDDESVSCYCIRGADIPSLQEGGVGKMPTRFLKPSSVEKRQLMDGDLAIEISGGSPTQCTGRPVLVSDGLLRSLGRPLVASNFCRIVKLKSPAFSKFVYCWLRSLYEAGSLFQFETGTTGIKNFAFVLFSEKYPLVVPDPRIAEAFDHTVSPLFARIQANAHQSRTLATMRDTLLPKLLSGELEISKATSTQPEKQRLNT